MTTIISGKEFRDQKENELLSKDLSKYHLLIFQIGNNKASDLYIKNKINFAKKINVKINVFYYNEMTTQVLLKEIKNKINYYKNKNEKVGIIIQQPMTKDIDKDELFSTTDKDILQADVECIFYQNMINLFKAKTVKDEPKILPCTPLGIVDLLDNYASKNNIDDIYTGKTILIIGRSQILGLPLSQMLQHRNATVINAHSKTTNLNELCNIADIIIPCVGKKDLIQTAKDNAIVIDAGISYDENNKINGDLSKKLINKGTLQAYTPTPGGTGPVTVYEIFNNLQNI